MEAHLDVNDYFIGSYIFQEPYDEFISQGFILSEEFVEGTSEGKASM